MRYQEKVYTRADVRNLFEKVKKNPHIEFYRGYTEEHAYGWDIESDDYIKSNKDDWFPNPYYDNSIEVLVKEFKKTMCTAQSIFDTLCEKYMAFTEIKDGDIE